MHMAPRAAAWVAWAAWTCKVWVRRLEPSRKDFDVEKSGLRPALLFGAPGGAKALSAPAIAAPYVYSHCNEEVISNDAAALFRAKHLGAERRASR
jgi:hypothetical protein